MIDLLYWLAVVSSPGKFEHEEAFTPYYWNLEMHGDGEFHTFYADDDPDGECEPIAEFVEFVVDGEESEIFALDCGDYVLLWSDSQGFAFGQDFTSREAMFEFINRYNGSAV